MVENIAGMAHMTGEPLRRWREGMAASVGARLLDADRGDSQTPSV